jgi:hypothetical protein
MSCNNLNNNRKIRLSSIKPGAALNAVQSRAVIETSAMGGSALSGV